jgi:cholesterol oxidase
MAVSEGTWNLMVDDPHVHAKRMKYLLKLNGATGPLIFEGFKQIHDDPGADIWADTSTLFVTIYNADRSKSRRTRRPAHHAGRLRQADDHAADHGRGQPG